ncbi:hypothetical protein GOP47_0021579 [Adiantum capillus-veneris]|uniref:MSP domain-containing protein n=1 Tax=Adiantum capillus-veneris TaxID=13818 RepID=A0A9D4U828_ADICA|nr:hypothetical protein GOP47_0021579 [Adiantum capillus-veneris]
MLVAKSTSDTRVTQEKGAHHAKTQDKGVCSKASQAITTALEVVRESNSAEEVASTGTSSSALSTAVSSASSSLSSSSLSGSSPLGGNRGGWKGMSLCQRPLWQQQNTHHPIGMRHVQPAQASSLSGHLYPPADLPSVAATDIEISATSRILKALLVSRRRLRFEPSNKLYFPYEPGKQSTSAVRIRNISRSNVAFKFQTTAPKSCFMRPPTGVLSPGEAIIATVVKFIELPKSVEQGVQVPLKRRTRDKFKIVSLKIHEDLEFTPELFEEHRQNVAVEQILQVVLLDPKQPSSQLERLKVLMSEADSAQEAQSKSSKNQKPNNIHDVSVLEEWKQRKLARQQTK